MEKLLISNTPHVRSSATTKRIMLDVVIALCPAAIFGIVAFGLNAFLIIALSILSCVASEVCYRLIRKEKFMNIIKTMDFTSVVTGLILAMNLGSQVPLYVPVFGGMFSIIVVKMLFGGTGKNFVNPAIAGRVFLLISFGSVMGSGWLNPSIGTIQEVGANGVPSILDLFLGTGIAGCLGETSKLCLLIGGIYLCIRGVIDWKYPLIYILVAGLTLALYKGDFNIFLPSILSGGLFLGAIFMATDYVTTPNTTIGNIVYFVVLGVMTGIFRGVAGGEVVSYCILFMNLLVPLIDRFIVPKPFGYQKPEKKKKEDK